MFRYDETSQLRAQLAATIAAGILSNKLYGTLDPLIVAEDPLIVADRAVTQADAILQKVRRGQEEAEETERLAGEAEVALNEFGGFEPKTFEEYLATRGDAPDAAHAALSDPMRPCQQCGVMGTSRMTAHNPGCPYREHNPRPTVQDSVLETSNSHVVSAPEFKGRQFYFYLSESPDCYATIHLCDEQEGCDDVYTFMEKPSERIMSDDSDMDGLQSYLQGLNIMGAEDRITKGVA